MIICKKVMPFVYKNLALFHQHGLDQSLSVWQHWQRLPTARWMPHPWKHSRSGWMGLWSTWSSWRCPCSWQGGGARWSLKVPSCTNYALILWQSHLQSIPWKPTRGQPLVTHILGDICEKPICPLYQEVW